MVFDQVLFYAFAAVTVIASLLVIGQRNPIYSVLLLILSFGGLAGLYVLLDAPFVAVIQIIIYAGAIMVLFLFVVMLLNVPQEDEPGEYIPPISSGARRFGALLGLVFVVEIGWALMRRSTDLADMGVGPGGGRPSVREIGVALFGPYAFAFEVTSILILVAMVGAVILAQRPGRAER